MSKSLQKIIILFLVFIIVFNMSIPIICHAEDINTDQQFDDAGVEATWKEIGGDAIDGIVGVLTWIPRAIIAAITIPTQAIITFLCGITGDGAILTAEDIIFTGSSRNQQVNILNVNFFDFSGNGANESIVKSFRENVAKWYFNIRNIAIILSLAVLIYIGIRMAISSVASDKAMYKKMLIDWTLGFAVLVLLHYAIVIILNLNNQLVELIYSIGPGTSTVMQDYTTALMKGIFSSSFVKGWGSLIIYVILIGTTIALFIMYMKRLFTVGFLIVISPLITVTYSIDKLGDGKSQALDTWFKEFTYNVLIQPFHCIIYMVFTSTAIYTLDSHKSLGNLVFAVLSVLFIFKAEDIVKKIFGFEKASSMGGMAAAGAIAATAINKISGSAGKAAKAAGTAASKSKTGGIQRKEIPSNTSNNPSNTSIIPTGEGSLANTSTTSDRTKKPSEFDINNSRKTSTFSFSDSALARAAKDFKDEKWSGVKEFFADPKANLLNSAKQIPLKQLAATAKFAPKLLAGGIIAGATGNGMNGIITGYATTGGKYTRKVQSLAEEDLSELNMEKQDKKLAAAYEKFRMSNNNLSDEELYNKSADLLEADIDTLVDKNERDLARQLQNMKALYEARGYSDQDSDVKVMDRLENIQMGDLKNSVSIKLDKVENAVKNYRSVQPTSMSNGDIENIAKDFMNEIDRMKAKKYLKSEQFKALNKSEKELAKEICKSKEVLEALGVNDSKAINKEIESAIKRGLSEDK